MNSQYSKFKKLLNEANDILIIQAENPDADSLGSALALEAILLEQNKNPILYCDVGMPDYLKYMKGWDRVISTFPNNFDLSIIVDASTSTLLEKLFSSGNYKKLQQKPNIVLDHHATVENEIDFSDVLINDDNFSSTGELIYILFKSIEIKIPLDAQEFILFSILGDTQGLTNQLASSNTYRVVADLIDSGVDRPLLEEQRREYSKMAKSIFEYKGRLIERTKFIDDDKIAYVTIPQTEISKYSPLYNPAALIQYDLLQTKGVKLAIVFKTYADGKVTAAIRSNSDSPIAGKLAQQMNGGGHDFASGFKEISSRDSEEIINDCLAKAQALL